MNIFNNFLFLTCVNCRGVSAVVTRCGSFLLFSISCGVLISDSKSGFEKWQNDVQWSVGDKTCSST